jgi:uncharacterized protein (DUF1800 family)
MSRDVSQTAVLLRTAPAELAPPDPVWALLHRAGFGPRPGDVERVREMGVASYIEEQLHPPSGDDGECLKRLRAMTMPIEYEAETGKWPAVKENRPLSLLNKPLDVLWQLTKENTPYGEWYRCIEEVRAAAVVRAVYSRWQLREVLVDFWHNHFSVNAGQNEKIAATIPIYDRDVIRRHALGNFRAFLEAVTRSAAMQYYLNAASSRASPANENYARELLELHTLGVENYYNHLYNRWREVPGALEGKPIGYIDQDVYEAARSFTGWTTADGTETSSGDVFPKTGSFHYYDGWHDNYQKRVLGVEFEPNQPPLADGQKVLDLVGFHPATARHVCTKLCRRFVADDPSPALIDSAVRVWIARRDKDDQIQATLRAILFSPELAASWGSKVKRPTHLVASFFRATEADVTPNGDLHYALTVMGERRLEWPTPAGHPDRSAYWVSTNMMLARWNTPLDLMGEDMKSARFAIHAVTPASVRSARAITDFWTRRMLGGAVTARSMRALVDYLRGDNRPEKALGEDDRQERLGPFVALVAMTPEFQLT